MQFTLLQENLKQALIYLQKAVPHKPQLPILSCILLEAKDGYLTLSATDLYFGVKAKIPAEIKEDGLIALPGENFKSIINSLSSGKLEFTQNEQTVIIKRAGNKMSIPFQVPDEFPQFPQISGERISFSNEEMDKILKGVSFCASLDQTRPVLTAILLKIANNQLEAVTTDGFRLSVLKMPINISGEYELLVPAKAFAEVIRIATLLDEKSIISEVSIEQKLIKFTIGANEFYVRLIEGEFPPYQKIMPDEFKTLVQIPADQLAEEVKRALLFAKETSNIVRLTISKNQVTIMSTSPSLGTYHGDIQIKENNSEESQEIAFNGNYLLDLFNNNQEDVVNFKMNESLKPAQFDFNNPDSYRYIVMPFRVNT